MALYETVFIARRDISAKTTRKTSAKDFGKIVTTGRGGEVKKNRKLGSFATSLTKSRKNRKGHYTLLHIDGPAFRRSSRMERNMRNNEDVLRYMTVQHRKTAGRPLGRPEALGRRP